MTDEREAWIRKVVQLNFPMSDWEAMSQFARDAMAFADAHREAGGGSDG